MPAKELRDELRKLRKEVMKPVSKMRVKDVSAEIERLKVSTEETPASAAYSSSRPKKMASSVESIKEAKRMEFPVAPTESKKKVQAKPVKKEKEIKVKVPAPKKKVKMVAESESDDE